MALFGNRVKEQITATAGTATFQLEGNVPATFRAFGSEFNDNDAQIPYVALHLGDGSWEIGEGTYITATNDLQRDTVLQNSLGTTAKINFAAGIVEIFSDVTANGLSSLFRNFDTKADVEAASIATIINSIQINGYYTAGDGGHAIYKRVGSAPSHNLKVQSADLAWWELAPDAEGINVRQAGAVGDGTTDDIQAFNDVEAYDVGAVIIPSGTYRCSTAPTGFGVVYKLHSDATVVLDSGTWNPLRYETNEGRAYSRKVNPITANPSVPVEFYAMLDDAPGLHDYWINEWGDQELDTDGKLSGAFTEGKIPGGRSRMMRTGANQLRLQGNHTGKGDGYNQFNSMAVSEHSDNALIVAWGGANSGGLFGGQVSALSNQVNLYGMGDIVLTDNGYGDVAMLGNVTILNKDGTDVELYNVPRFNFMAMSSGEDIDASFITKGNYFLGMDFGSGTFSSDFAISMSEGQRIGFDALAPQTGRFSTTQPGGYWIEKSGAFLALVADNVDIVNLYSDRFEVRPGVNSAFAHRLYGADATPFLSFGQIGVTSYVTAASLGTDNTTLILRTAATGVEADRLVIESAGHTRPGAASTYNLGTFGSPWLNVYATNYRAGATQVLTARKTGWAPSNGTATRAFFNTTSVTLEQLAEHVKALLDDLTAHGMIGA